MVLAVVDPGVGTARRAVAVEVGDDPASVFVGPDNGLLAPAVGMAGGAGRAVSLTNDDYHLPSPGPTFAGRDVFAPAAAHLCAGVDIAELGELIDAGTLQPGLLPLTRHEDATVLGEVLWIDRFGNAQLNVDPDEVAAMGDVVTLHAGRAGADGGARHRVRRARRGPARARRRLLRPARARTRSAIGRRGAATCTRATPSRWRPRDEDGHVRPGTTITLALLLLGIFAAAIVQFVVLGR